MKFYVDTSVWRGIEDAEFSAWTVPFFNQVREGTFIVVLSDAQHIAIATILKVDSLVSWNYKHMVNFFRIRLFNSINLKYGYSTIDIRTPKEVIYEK